ncbi:Urea-proton symporter DUR3 [Rhodotorula toruloides]|nr:Urea-proton symporter DUR3 [Rhodotorula toruloides]
MIFLTRLQGRFTRLDPNSATEFATALRTVKPGLICCGIVSTWTWLATLLQSSAATYSSGLSSAWWYGVGGTIQICFFAACAAKIKQNANGTVTFPEIARARYGWPCHLLFTSGFLICAHIVTGSLVLGASATINALTGANIIATNFLLPLGMPPAAVTIIGDGGVIAILLVVFMAATFACSAELIAVSSLVTRDIIEAYRLLSGPSHPPANKTYCLYRGPRTLFDFLDSTGCFPQLSTQAKVEKKEK